MRIEHAGIPGILLITPAVFSDARGYFCETFRQDLFAELGGAPQFVQDNQALSKNAGVVRGLHYQSPPFAQAKLIRVLRGRILDVAVDIRIGSTTFGQHVAAELCAVSKQQMYIPEGFAHGYATLEPDTEIAYKVSAYYAPAHDRGIFWADPALDIAWPIDKSSAILSPKDTKLPHLGDVDSPFVYAAPA
jgi:dTDP-4-dehydrorhamnose 3,5-epimerase